MEFYDLKTLHCDREGWERCYFQQVVSVRNGVINTYYIIVVISGEKKINNIWREPLAMRIAVIVGNTPNSEYSERTRVGRRSNLISAVNYYCRAIAENRKTRYFSPSAVIERNLCSW